MEEYDTLQAMLDQANNHNLQMECLMTLIHSIAGDISGEPLNLDRECANALNEWDI